MKKKVFITVLLVVLVVIGAVVKNNISEKSDFENIPLCSVKQGPLIVSITESGTLESKNKIVVKSQVRGRNRIVSLIEEGKRVDAGDVLIELDSSTLEENLIDQKIQVENAEADLISARETLAITKNQVVADNEKAELALKFAKLDLEKYINGEYPQELQQLQSEITIQGEELKRKKDDLEWSKKLAEKEYITRSELEADELAVKQSELNLEIAKNKLEVLQKYTYPQQVEQLKSDVKQAEMSLERTIRSGKADIIKAEANYRAKQSAFNQQSSRLKEIQEQLEYCTIKAPASGMVVYAKSRHRWRSQEPLDIGVEVNERQALIELPEETNLIVKVSIPEASITKITTNQNVLITVEGIPNQTYKGKVSSIAILPDVSRSWMNPDLKFYDCKIQLFDPPEGVRPGNSCTAEIILKEFDNAIYIPDQCIQIFDDQSIVFVMTDSGPERRVVETDLSNNIMVVIKSGLKVGEKVLLAPPLISEANDKTDNK